MDTALEGGSSGGSDDDYQRVKDKRQKLREKKRRQKASKQQEAAPPPPPTTPLCVHVLSDEGERQRLWMLDGIKPSSDAIDQALAGHSAAHPMLLRMLQAADSSYPPALTAVLDSHPSARAVARRLTLTQAPLTYEAITSAVDSLHLTR